MNEERFIIAICGDGKLGIRDLTTLNEYTSERQVADYMNRITDENEQLKQRNNRQAKQLDSLYNLIEEKDWRTLTDIIDDFQQCEERLQKEWKCYE